MSSALLDTLQYGEALHTSAREFRHKMAQNVSVVASAYFAAHKQLTLYCVSLSQCPTVLLMNAKTVVELV